MTDVCVWGGEHLHASNTTESRGFSDTKRGDEDGEVLGYPSVAIGCVGGSESDRTGRRGKRKALVSLIGEVQAVPPETEDHQRSVRLKETSPSAVR